MFLIPLVLGGDAKAAPPVVSNVQVAVQTLGGCPGPTDDVLRTTWDISGANNFYFVTRVVRTGAWSGTTSGLDNTTVLLDFNGVGSSEATGTRSSKTFTSTVEVLDRETGEVVASAQGQLIYTTGTTCGGEA